MYNYCIIDLDDPKLIDDVIKMDAVFESEDGERIDGEIDIAFTTNNDIVLRVYPWGSNQNKSDFGPVSYDLKGISTDFVSEKNGEFRVRTEGIKIQINNEKIALTKNDTTVEIVLNRTTDLKGNLCTNGTGFKTKTFNNNPQKVEETSFNIRMNSNERIYGGGERFKRVNHTGSDLKVQVTQGAGAKNDKTYKSAPRFVSDRGYGYSVNTYNTVTGHFGTQSSEITEITSNDSSIEFLFTIEGNINDCLRKMYKYESNNKNPSLWSYGFWSSRNTYESWDEVMDIAQQYRNRDIPCDVIHLDPAWLGYFDNYDLNWADSFDKAEDYIEKLHSIGFKISIWIYPYVPISSSMYKNTDKSYFVDDAGGGKFIFDDKQKLALVDFTNPDALEWWSSKLSNVISDGVDIIKADFAEYVDENTVFHNGRTGHEMRNAYPDIYQEACVSAFRKAGREPLLWSRSGWLSQNEHSIHWNGDAESDWQGYRSTIQSGLNAAMSSYSFWSSDVGGYKKDPSDELYGEWMKFSAFGSPHIRAHGKSPREPWKYPNSYEDSKTVLQERYKLMPYLYSYGQIAEENGLPIMRPEILSVDDPSYYNENSQYFMGDHLLVAPYLTPDKSRSVYLPEDSNWISYWDHTEYEGGQEISFDYNDYIIPVFVRKGSAIPMFSDYVQSIDENNYDTNLRVYGTPESDVVTPYYNGEELLEITVDSEGEIDLENYDLDDEFNNIIR